MSVRIYTKKGDQGQTSLFGGDPVEKSDSRLEAYGTLDELNSQIGVALSQWPDLPDLKALGMILRRVQNDLFTIGSHLAVGDEEMRRHLPEIRAASVAELERAIDDMETRLPKLKNFILPGGTTTAATLHLARTIARRAERATVASRPRAAAGVLIYLNRLSDFLFVAARFANQCGGGTDQIWEKN